MASSPMRIGLQIPNFNFPGVGPGDLLDTLKQCVERLDRYRRPSQRVGESNTKAGLIEPVIAALG